MCMHLQALFEELTRKKIKVTYRGQAWSDNCSEWIYYDCYLDNESIRNRLKFDECVKDHSHLGTHDGQESGFFCEQCKDGIMGVHKIYSKDKIIII